MKFSLLILVTLFSTIYSFGQDKKDLSVSFSAGLLNSPYYQKASARGFYKVDFDYHLSKRHSVSVNYLGGEHTYYDNTLSNNPNGAHRADGTNSEARYRVVSISYKYKILDNDLLNVVSGAGIGIMNHEREYPYQGDEIPDFKISSFSDIAFPITVDINFKISRRWQAGLTSGFFIEPDYPTLAYHLGPKLSYIIK